MDTHMEGMASSFPVKTKQIAVNVKGNKTEILCSQFADRLFIIVTQYNKIGSLVELTRDIVLEEGVVPARSSYSTKVLLGIDEHVYLQPRVWPEQVSTVMTEKMPLTHVLAKNLLAKVDQTKPLLLGMSLKDKSPQTVSALSEAVKEVL